MITPSPVGSCHMMGRAGWVQIGRCTNWEENRKKKVKGRWLAQQRRTEEQLVTARSTVGLAEASSVWGNLYQPLNCLK